MRTALTAIAAAVSLFLSVSQARADDRAPGPDADAPRGPPRTRPATPRRAPDPPPPDPDAEVIAHLEELEKMELLENLELFDALGERERPTALP